MATARNLFEYTATGLLGDKRRSMLKNELHIRSELARSKWHGYNSCPGNTFCYGLSNPKQNYGVKESLKWNVNFDPLKERSETAHTRTSTKLLPATSALNEVFGIPARPSTPIRGVLEFKYQDDWIEQQRCLQAAKRLKAQAKTLPPGAFRENRTSQLRQTRTAVASADKLSLWHMPKFLKVQKQVDTFQTESDHSNADAVNSTSTDE